MSILASINYNTLQWISYQQLCNSYINHETKACVVCISCMHLPMHVYSALRWQGLTLAGVSLAVSESDQRCLSWEELGTHSQNVCIGQTDRATSVGVCSSYMCNQACEHMCTHKHMHAWTNTHRETKVLDLHLERDSALKHVFDLWTKLCDFNVMKHISAGVYNSLQMYKKSAFCGLKMAQYAIYCMKTSWTLQGYNADKRPRLTPRGEHR